MINKYMSKIMQQKYIKYCDIVKHLNIQHGDVILLSSNMVKTILYAKKYEKEFSYNKFLDSFIEAVGSDGTLLIPSYNWDFCKGIPFDYYNTQSKTGVLANEAMKRSDFKRTKHPLYSHIVYGKDKDYLCSLDYIDAFGADSIFAYLTNNNAKNVGIDVDLDGCFSTIYYFEQKYGVPYRYIKYFKSSYIDENGISSVKTYSMNVRYAEINSKFSGKEMYEYLKNNKAVEEYHINKSFVSIFNIKKTEMYIKDDILNNNSKKFMIYDMDKLNSFNKDKGYSIIKDLFSINRSLSGNGNRETLNYLKENCLGELQIKEYSVKENPETFDWKTPYEWNINNAYIEDENGNKIVDFKNNNLHILGYSEPVDITIPFSELDKYLYSLENDIDAIPYTTSYYKKRWGFCITHRQREELCKSPEKQYHVVIDSSFNENGYITYGELIINGYEDDEILISTYICHPSMANDNLSGIAAAVAAAKYIYALPERKYTYRIIFIPETIGALIYLKENIEHLKKSVKAGFVLSCIGDDGDYSCVHTPYNNTYTDKIVSHVLKHITDSPKEYSFLERGSDERQFCAPLVNLPVCTLSRTKFGKFKEYHTSNDNLDFVTEIGLGGGLNYIQQCINILENNEYYKIKTVGEPQLGKYGLYPTISQKVSADYTRNLTNIIAYLNGSNSILDIAELLNMHFNSVLNIINKLKENNLIDKCEK